MEETDILCLSQLLAQNIELSPSDLAPEYCWTKHFNPDYTFSPFKFKKKALKNGEDITPAALRNNLLCLMMDKHNVLYELPNYKGKLKGTVHFYIFYFFM
jgi:hypothetical protein